MVVTHWLGKLTLGFVLGGALALLNASGVLSAPRLEWLAKLWRKDMVSRWLLLTVPLVAAWLVSKARSTERAHAKAKGSCLMDALDWVLPARMRGTLGLSRPCAAPGLTQLYILSFPWYFLIDYSTTPPLPGGLLGRIHVLRACLTSQGVCQSSFLVVGALFYVCVALLLLLVALFFAGCRLSCASLRSPEQKGEGAGDRKRDDQQEAEDTSANPGTARTETQRASLTKQELEDWLKSDQPSKVDFFAQPDYATQLCEWFEKSRTRGGLGGLRLIGGAGSGKTSVGQQLAQQWQRPKRGTGVHSFVHVDAWAYADGLELVEGTLTSIQNAIGSYDGSHATRRLAQRFAQAAGHGGYSVGAALDTLLRPRESPTEVIESFEAVLKRLDAWLILWVDDLDRFLKFEEVGREGPAGAPTKPTTLQQTRSASDVRAIASLLHALVQQPRIGLVCALTEWDFPVASDPEKLFANDRELPSLTFEHWVSVVQVFREKLLLPEVRGSDPAPEGMREGFAACFQPNPVMIVHETYDPDKKAIYAAIMKFNQAFLAKTLTPRKLKVALNATLARFAPIASIADRDEILLLELTRALEPEIYAQVRKRLSQHAYGHLPEVAEEPPSAGVIDAGSGKKTPKTKGNRHSLVDALLHWFIERDGNHEGDPPWAHLKSLASPFARAVTMQPHFDWPNPVWVKELATFTAALEAFASDPKPQHTTALIELLRQPCVWHPSSRYHVLHYVKGRLTAHMEGERGEASNMILAQVLRITFAEYCGLADAIGFWRLATVHAIHLNSRELWAPELLARAKAPPEAPGVLRSSLQSFGDEHGSRAVFAFGVALISEVANHLCLKRSPTREAEAERDAFAHEALADVQRMLCDDANPCNEGLLITLRNATRLMFKGGHDVVPWEIAGEVRAPFARLVRALIERQRPGDEPACLLLVMVEKQYARGQPPEFLFRYELRHDWRQRLINIAAERAPEEPLGDAEERALGEAVDALAARFFEHEPNDASVLQRDFDSLREAYLASLKPRADV